MHALQLHNKGLNSLIKGYNIYKSHSYSLESKDEQTFNYCDFRSNWAQEILKEKTLRVIRKGLSWS